MVTEQILVHGLKMAYETNGEGPVVLLIHGWAGYRKQWSEAPKYLKDFRTIALDLHGFGDSEESLQITAPEDYVGPVLEFIRVLGVSRLFLVGHSAGGIVAANVALRYADKVDGLVLVEVPVGRELQSAKFPILLVFGDRDSDMGGASRLQVSRTQLAEIPSADLKFIGHAGHSPMLENASEFYGVLRNFAEKAPTS